MSFGTFLFLAFKGGFVRHDSHSFFAAAAIILVPFGIGFLAQRPQNRLSLIWLCVVAWLVIDGAYIRSLPDILYFNLFKTYTQGAEGFSERFLKPAALNQSFAEHLAAIARKANLPKLSGTTDIYSYGQADLLASGSNWHPRPVLQSYSAYTSHLAQLDREYLVSGDAPENILFRLETIDGRFPSLDDGPSWPVLLAKYTPSDEMTESDYLLLRRQAAAAELKLQQTLSRTFQLGQTLPVPEHRLLFAQFNIQPSFFGRVASLFYKTDPLRMSVTLANGQTRDFRLVSGMARAGFLLSPLVQNTQEFFYLFGTSSALNENVVRTVRIDGNSLFWKPAYTVEISAVDASPSGADARGAKLAQAVTEGPPSGLPVSEMDKCEGSIDFVNGSPLGPTTKITALLSIGGWMTIAGKEGVTPDNVFAVLTAENGRALYVKSAHVPRPDVTAYFGRPDMRNPGFTVTIDTTGLSENLAVQLAREVNGRIEICGNLKLSLGRGSGPVLATPTTRSQPEYDPIDVAVAMLKEEPRGPCEGYIDGLNASVPDRSENKVSGTMQVRGWTTISGKDGIVPDAVFVRLTDQSGKTLFIRTRAMPREDVKNFFGQAKLPDPGFLANIDTSKLDGHYSLGLSRLYQGTLERCEQLAFPVTVRH